LHVSSPELNNGSESRFEHFFELIDTECIFEWERRVSENERKNEPM